MVPTVSPGSSLLVEFFLDAHDLRTFGFQLFEREPPGGEKGLTTVIPEAGLVHFLGEVLALREETAYPQSDPVLGGLPGLVAELDCGFPVTLSGRFGRDDPLFNIDGRWIEGVATLWGLSLWADRERPLSASAKALRDVHGVVLAIKEWPSVKRFRGDLILRSITLRLSSSDRQH